MSSRRHGGSRASGWPTHGDPLKAFLLAAGEGRRLRPLTDSIPKCLVPIRGVPLLGLWLQLLESHGITEVLVNLHHRAQQVSEFLGAYPTPLRIRTAYETRLLGSGGTVAANRRFVEGEATFLIAYADNLTTADLTALTRFHHRRSEPMTIGVVPTDKPREKGTVRLGPDRQVLEFAEKAPDPPSNLANAGIYVAGQAIFEYLPPVVADEVVDFGYHVLPKMVPHLAAFEIGEFLMDIGTHADYERAQALWPGLPA